MRKISDTTNGNVPDGEMSGMKCKFVRGKNIDVFKGIVLLGAVICISSIVLLFSLNRAEAGSVNNFDELSAKLNIKPIFADFETHGELYYRLIGTTAAWEANILGKFSSQTVSLINHSPGEMELPSPQLSYEDHVPISALAFRMLPVPPENVAKELMLTKAGETNDEIRSQLDDNLVYFQGVRGGYRFELYLLGKSNYFILRIIQVR